MTMPHATAELMSAFLDGLAYTLPNSQSLSEEQLAQCVGMLLDYIAQLHGRPAATSAWSKGWAYLVTARALRASGEYDIDPPTP